MITQKNVYFLLCFELVPIFKGNFLAIFHSEDKYEITYLPLLQNLSRRVVLVGFGRVRVFSTVK